MDWGILPPEISSGRIYAGPGAGSYLAAATSWASLSEELSTTAQVHRSIMSELATAWLGASSTHAVAAGITYLLWLETTAAQAAQTATNLAAAASAYETAHAAHVPPPVIAANRSLLAMLVATNFLGINTPAIMATEAHYAEMWAQDAAAMYAYLASSAETWKLDPFTPVAPLTHPVPAAASSVSTGNVRTILSDLGLNIFAPGSNMSTTGLSGLINIVSGSTGSSFGSLLNSNILSNSALGSPISSGVYSPGSLLYPAVALGQTDQQIQQGQGQQNPPTPKNPNGLPTYPLPAYPEAPSAATTSATKVGGLSVPSTWTDSTPPVAQPATAVPGMYGAAPAAKNYGQTPRYGRKLTVMPKTPC